MPVLRCAVAAAMTITTNHSCRGGRRLLLNLRCSHFCRPVRVMDAFAALYDTHVGTLQLRHSRSAVGSCKAPSRKPQVPFLDSITTQYEDELLASFGTKVGGESCITEASCENVLGESDARGIKRNKTTTEETTQSRCGASCSERKPKQSRGGASCSKRKVSRRSFNKIDLVSLGQAADTFRLQFIEISGTARGWINAFLAEEFHIEPHDTVVFRQTRCKLRSAVAAAKKPIVAVPIVRGRRNLTSTVPASLRRRHFGAGARVKAIEIEEELWHWFVDRINTVKTRVTSEMILSQGRLVAADLIEYWRKKCDAGQADPALSPVVPCWDGHFVYRWRRRYGITWRTVNLRYKISEAKRKLRIKIFWCNALRLRIFHELLFGADLLRFVGFDQKPFYFNTSVASKTLALASSRKVAVKESVAASRERFTVMTTCPSWTLGGESCLEGSASSSGDGGSRLETAPIAVLFKAQSENGTIMRSRMSTPPNTLLQFAEKGSYRLQNVLDWLLWSMDTQRLGRPWDLAKADETGVATDEASTTAQVAPVATVKAVAAAQAVPAATVESVAPTTAQAVPAAMAQAVPAATAQAVLAATAKAVPARVPDGRHTIVVTLDWYAPHLDSSVDDAMHDLGHSVLRIGGGITDSVQVPDTHRHKPYTGIYRETEAQDADRQLRRHPNALPSYSRQTVLVRAVDTWNATPQSKCRQEWIQNGVLNSLDGKEDGDIRSELRGLWECLEMNAVRDQLRLEIESEVKAGRLRDWWQYPDILEPYDEHEGLHEGWEGAGVTVLSDDDESNANTDEEGEDTPAAIRDEVNTAEAGRGATEGLSAEAGEGAAAAAEDTQGLAAEAASARSTTHGLTEEQLRLAKADLDKTLGKKRLAALAEVARVLREGGDHETANSLEGKLKTLMKKQEGLSADASTYLRAKAMKRREVDLQKQEQGREELARLKELETRLRLAKTNAERKKSEAQIEKIQSKQIVLAAEAAKQSKKEALADQKTVQELLRCHFVHFCVSKSLAWVTDAAQGKQRRKVLMHATTNTKRGSLNKACSPVPWSREDRRGYLMITTPAAFEQVKRQRKEYCSERLAHVLFGNKHPHKAKTSEAVWSRMNKLLDEAMPGYTDLFVGQALGKQLLDKYDGNCDLAVFEAMYRYSQVVGAERYPCGILEWPLVDDMRNLFLKQMQKDKLYNVAAGAAEAAGAADFVVPTQHIGGASSSRDPAPTSSAVRKGVGAGGGSCLASSAGGGSSFASGAGGASRAGGHAGGATSSHVPPPSKRAALTGVASVDGGASCLDSGAGGGSCLASGAGGGSCPARSASGGASCLARRADGHPGGASCNAVVKLERSEVLGPHRGTTKVPNLYSKWSDKP